MYYGVEERRPRYVGSIDHNAAASTVYTSNLSSDYLDTGCVLCLYLLVQYLNLSQMHVLCRGGCTPTYSAMQHSSRTFHGLHIPSFARHLI